MTARAASGRRGLPARAALAGALLAIATASMGAWMAGSAPPALASLVTGAEGQLELEPKSEQGESKPEWFGTSVAVSADGDTAIVGAPGEGSRPGTAWVFVRKGGEWVQQQELTQPAGEGAGKGTKRCEPPGEPGGCLFGESVALSGDGDVAIVGAPPKTAGAGAAYLFTRAGDPAVWTMADELSIADERGALDFGEAVALAEDGEAALVGAPLADHASGEAWGFRLEDGQWVTTGRLDVIGEPDQSHFGEALALSADGTAALLGAPTEDERGAAYTFENPGTGWQKVAKLTGTGEDSEADFGQGVALSAGGGEALIGAPHDSEGASRAGAAWAFALAEGSPSSSPQKLAGGDGTTPAQAGEEFGSAVALSGSGTVALVGAPLAAPPPGKSKEGAAWLFTSQEGAPGQTGITWETPVEVLDETGADDSGHFGQSVGLDGGGQTLLVGSPRAFAKEGAAWLFGDRPVIGSLAPNRGAFKGDTAVTIKGANFTEVPAQDGVFFGSTPAVSYEVKSANEIIAVAPPETSGTEVTLEGERRVMVDVRVETQGWLSAENSSDVYSYVERASTEEHRKEKEKEREKEREREKQNEKEAEGSGGGQAPFSGKLPTGIVVNDEAKIGVLSERTRYTPCTVHARSATVPVGSSSRAALTLLASGSGRCAGRVELTFQQRVGGRTRAQQLGSLSYGLSAGHSEKLLIKLDAAARALLRSHGGRLRATLVIARSEPSPARALTASVTLARHG